MVWTNTLDWAWEMDMKEAAANGDKRAEEALHKYKNGEI